MALFVPYRTVKVQIGDKGGNACFREAISQKKYHRALKRSNIWDFLTVHLYPLGLLVEVTIESGFQYLHNNRACQVYLNLLEMRAINSCKVLHLLISE